MYWAALILGFAGSLHCVGMCGPIAVALPSGGSGLRKKASAAGLYHFGRTSAYALLGFLFGTLGFGLAVAEFQQGLSLGAGLIMLAAVWLPKTSLLGKVETPLYRLQAKAQSFMAKRLRDHRPSALLGIGFFNGFLPCGMVYIALAGAVVTTHPAQGAAFMALFGLGTVPALLLTAFGASALSSKMRLSLLRLAPYLASIIAILFIIRGLGLGIPFLSPELGFIVSPENNCAP